MLYSLERSHLFVEFRGLVLNTTYMMNIALMSFD